ncbi:unnamed protein product [Fraxinus pennsylvanica]|uniref:Uncharacterized protein n=1 Tax=Fraxinus pennsylvanica TaxID=56036 RepID=A0AAD1ZQC6_9LAMI|nr:unnamed protein product [Fraxinus pennsylvanica]
MGCVYSRSCIGEICAPRDIYVEETENVKAAAEIAVFSLAHSDSEEGEIIDELNQFARDNEVGITRLSRASTQFLPSDGLRAVEVPVGNYDWATRFCLGEDITLMLLIRLTMIVFAFTQGRTQP